ncbi:MULTISPECIES: hypothetical protein [Aphanothece]|uniref:hypothetical protein n=1 Tax=Aphanothece TaxID=1121 RepID=UPI00398E6655
MGGSKRSRSVEIEPTGPPQLATGLGAAGNAQLYLDGVLVAQAHFDTTVPIVFRIEGLSCGYDFGEAASCTRWCGISPAS